MKQRPKGAALPQASSQFLFLLFLGDDLRLLGAKRPCALRALPWALRLALRWGIRLALLKIYHKFFHQQVGQFFPLLFQLLFQQVFLLLLWQVFLQFCLSTLRRFPKYIAKSLTDNFPCVRISFSSFNFHF